MLECGIYFNVDNFDEFECIDVFLGFDVLRGFIGVCVNLFVGSGVIVVISVGDVWFKFGIYLDGYED